jgi:uncharacterized protein (TIGR02217 family)
MGASFHEVQFPPDISLGAVGGPGFKTTITVLSGGAEKRNIDWANAKGAWDVAHGLRTQMQLDALRAFFYARRGRAYGFRFKDSTDFNVPDEGGHNPLMFTTNGYDRAFQIVKVYSDAAGSYTRNMSKPVAGFVYVYDNDLPPTDYVVDLTPGIITLGSTLGSTTGDAISVACQFDVPARFDIDDMKITLTDIDNLAWGQIPIVEIRDI